MGGPTWCPAYGNPVVAGGKVFVGTNNQANRQPKAKGDKGVVMCFREKDGVFLWQLTHNKLQAGRVNDWPQQGICSSPCVEGKRLYYVNNRCELVCARRRRLSGRQERRSVQGGKANRQDRR